MASPWEGGPALCYIGISSQQNANRNIFQVPTFTPAFVGTCETGPDMDHRPHYENVMNDLAGSRVPYDRLYMGEDAMISMIFTIINQNTMRLIEAFLNTNKTAGTDGAIDRGTLIIAEQMYFPLWLLYANRNNPVMGVNGLNMPRGRHYFATVPENQVRTSPGRRANRKGVNMYAMGLYESQISQTSTNLTNTGASFKVWDEDVSAVEGVAPL